MARRLFKVEHNSIDHSKERGKSRGILVISVYRLGSFLRGEGTKEGGILWGEGCLLLSLIISQSNIKKMTNSFISQSLVVLFFFSHTHAFLKKSYSFSLYLWQISFRHLYSEKNAFKKTLCFVKNAKKNPTFFYKNAHDKITLYILCWLL